MSGEREGDEARETSRLPKLRPVERLELDRDGEALLVLRDPLGVSEPVALDAEFGPVLDLMDGTRSIAQIRQSLLMRGTMSLPAEDLEAFISDLEETGLLEGDRFRAMWSLIHHDFLEQDRRAARMAGVLYPGEAAPLAEYLLRAVGAPRLEPGLGLIGLMTPHQPPELIGNLLAQTMWPLPPPGELDLVVLLGTDHVPGLTPYALTDKDYDTPLGLVPTDADLVDAFEQRLPWIRREEIRHRQGTALELTSLLLRHAYGDRCPPTLPMLCGASGLTTREGRDGRDELLATAELLLAGRRVLWWASAELSHAGPAYGRPALAGGSADTIRAHDLDCLGPLLAGLPAQVARRCMEPFEQGRPSGTAVMDTLAHLLPIGYQAVLSGYETLGMPGDRQGLVGAAGLRFHQARGPIR